MDRILYRYIIFIAGLYFLSMGIVLIVSSTLGTTPISSVNYVLSLHTPLTLGIATFLINVILIAGQFWLIRGRGTRKDRMEILLQIPFSFIFSVFIDFNMALMSGVRPSGYAYALALLAAGCLCQAVGVVLELKPNVAIMSAEGFVKYAARRYNRDSAASSPFRCNTRDIGRDTVSVFLGPYRGCARRLCYSRCGHGLCGELSVSPRYDTRSLAPRGLSGAFTS